MESIQQDNRRSEARLRSIIQGSPIPQFVIDCNHRITYWNEALEKYSEIRAEDVIGTNQQWRAFYPQERPCLADLLVDGALDTIPKWYKENFSKSRLIEGAYEATGFFPGMGKGGTWLYFTAAPVKDEKGTIIGAVETLEDITGLKRAEEVIRESEQRYRHLIEAVTDYIFTVRIESGRVAETVHGPGCEGITGYTNGDFAADPGLWLRMIVMEDRGAVFDQSRDILAGKDVPAIEHRIIRKDGVLRWIRNTPVLHHDPQGLLISYDGLIQDITELKQADEAMQESEQRYRHLIEAVTDYIFTVRIESGRVAETVHGPGCEGITGYTSEDFASDPTLWFRMVVEVDRGAVFDQSRDILGGKEAPAIEHRIIRKDGVVRWVRNTPVLRHDPQGRLVAFDGLIQDITERRQADEALKQVIKKLNLLSNITRHDILNQLTALLGYLELSKEHAMDPVLRDYISKEEVSAETICRQITFTRDYQTVGINLPVWQNVRATIVHATGSLDLRAVALEIAPGDFEVYADPLLEKVFYNLVENALWHGEKLTRIAIHSLISPEGLILVCEDDGSGIPAAEKENIFHRKFFKHTGFGLFLSREILAITGLSIRENGEPGKGARFEITIPNGAYRSTSNG
ncbi:MAG: PAS domain S-box protein [Methanoregula sp.]|nr:PAS domain S-box protein [Methanoregula sp.]